MDRLETFGDVLEAEVVGQQGKEQHHHGDGNQGENTERRPPQRCESTPVGRSRTPIKAAAIA